MSEVHLRVAEAGEDRSAGEGAAVAADQVGDGLFRAYGETVGHGNKYRIMVRIFQAILGKKSGL